MGREEWGWSTPTVSVGIWWWWRWGFWIRQGKKNHHCECPKSAARAGWRSEQWCEIQPLAFSQLLWGRREYKWTDTQTVSTANQVGKRFAVIYQAKTEVFWRGKVLHVGNNLVFPVPKINHTDSKTTQAKDKHCLCIHISSAKAQGHLSGRVQCNWTRFFYSSATNFFSLFH